MSDHPADHQLLPFVDCTHLSLLSWFRASLQLLKHNAESIFTTLHKASWACKTHLALKTVLSHSWRFHSSFLTSLTLTLEPCGWSFHVLLFDGAPTRKHLFQHLCHTPNPADSVSGVSLLQTTSVWQCFRLRASGDIAVRMLPVTRVVECLAGLDGCFHYC